MLTKCSQKFSERFTARAAPPLRKLVSVSDPDTRLTRYRLIETLVEVASPAEDQCNREGPCAGLRFDLLSRVCASRSFNSWPVNELRTTSHDGRSCFGITPHGINDDQGHQHLGQLPLVGTPKGALTNQDVAD